MSRGRVLALPMQREWPAPGLSSGLRMRRDHTRRSRTEQARFARRLRADGHSRGEGRVMSTRRIRAVARWRPQPQGRLAQPPRGPQLQKPRREPASHDPEHPRRQHRGLRDGHLAKGYVQVWRGRIIQREVLDVAHDTHHLELRRPRGLHQLDRFPDRLFIGPMTSREGPAHDCDGLTVGAIVTGEFAALDHRDAGCGKVPGTRHAKMGLWDFIRRRRGAVGKAISMADRSPLSGRSDTMPLVSIPLIALSRS